MFKKGYIVAWEPFDNEKQPYYLCVGGTTFDIKKARKYSSVQEACLFIPKCKAVGYKGPTIRKA